MNNTIFSLNNGYHIGFGTLKDIDSYMIETEENLKIKYNVYIEDENRDTHYFYHKGGKPSGTNKAFSKSIPGLLK